MVGDLVTHVRGVYVSGRKKIEVLGMLKGKAGTTVALTITRANKSFEVPSTLLSGHLHTRTQMP